MSKTAKRLLWAAIILLLLLAGAYWLTRGDKAELSVAEVSGTDPVLGEAESENIPTIGLSKPIGWKQGEAPTAAEGLSVVRFAEGLEHPRVLYTMPNGDVLVTLTNRPQNDGRSGIRKLIEDWLFDFVGAGGGSPNKLVLLRDGDGDGVAEVQKVLREDLDSPSGIAWRDSTLYIANHNALLSFDYEAGDDAVLGDPKKLMDLPAGGGHWMRNILIDPEGTQIYVAVGSASNIGENGMDLETGRAAIWEHNLETGSSRQYAAGLRNPNGLAWNPFSGELWTTVNERDMLGSDLVPDYLTNVPIGAQYGWPWVYWRDIVDHRVTYPMPTYLVEYARKPEYALGPHVAALGMVFAGEGHRMGTQFGNGAFIARHGSWNRIPASGYDVVFVAFDERGNPLEEKPRPVLTGFLKENWETRGRPTWVTLAQDGALLVSDDTAGIIWRVIDSDAEPAPRMARERVKSLPPRRELRGDPSAAFKEDYARRVTAD